MLCAAIIGALCTFMPWVHVSSMRTLYGFDVVGWYTFSLFLILVILLLSFDKTKPVKNGLLLITIILSIIAGIIGVQKFFQFTSLSSSMSRNVFTQRMGNSMSVGFGLYLVVIAGFVLPLLAFLVKEKR